MVYGDQLEAAMSRRPLNWAAGFVQGVEEQRRGRRLPSRTGQRWVSCGLTGGTLESLGLFVPSSMFNGLEA